ncbi:transposase [Paenibacillus mucilaginosus]
MERMRNLKAAASRSVGLREGTVLAKLELQMLLTQYELLEGKFGELEARLDELLGQIPHVKQLMAIKGIGRDSMAGFLAEIGDIGRYRHPKQIIKLAGLKLKENTSGKHKDRRRSRNAVESDYEHCYFAS